MNARAELNPSVVDRIKATLVGLRMPRALEIVDAIVRQLERGEVSALEAIDAMLAEEFTLRESRRIKTSLVMARLSNIKTLTGYDFAFQPSLDRNRILALAELKFIDRTEVVHFIGPPGTGKSHLSVALGVEAVKAGRSVHFLTLADLVGSLAKAEREGTLREKIRFYCRFALLIVDEIGYLPVVPGGGNLFFQLVNARYERGAMILTSNRGFAEWGQVFGDPVIATVMRGILREQKRPVRPAAAITSTEIRLLLSGCGDDPGGAAGLPGLRDRALLLTCFAGGLRRSELVGLDREDVRFTPEGLVLRIRHSKGDQEGEGADVGIARGSRPHTCPVRAMEMQEARDDYMFTSLHHDPSFVALTMLAPGHGMMMSGSKMN